MKPDLGRFIPRTIVGRTVLATSLALNCSFGLYQEASSPARDQAINRTADTMQPGEYKITVTTDPTTQDVCATVLFQSTNSDFLPTKNSSCVGPDQKEPGLFIHGSMIAPDEPTAIFALDSQHNLGSLELTYGRNDASVSADDTNQIAYAIVEDLPYAVSLTDKNGDPYGGVIYPAAAFAEIQGILQAAKEQTEKNQVTPNDSTEDQLASTATPAAPMAKENVTYTTEGISLNPDGSYAGGFMVPGYSDGPLTIKTPVSEERMAYTTEGASLNNDGTVKNGVVVPGYPAGPLTIQESPTPIS